MKDCTAGSSRSHLATRTSTSRTTSAARMIHTGLNHLLFVSGKVDFVIVIRQRSSREWTIPHLAGQANRRRSAANGSQLERASIAPISFGTTVKTSPTRPKSATSKIGTSASLLMAMIVFAVCIPDRCCIAPEIPSVTYSCGETLTPVGRPARTAEHTLRPLPPGRRPLPRRVRRRAAGESPAARPPARSQPRISARHRGNRARGWGLFHPPACAAWPRQPAMRGRYSSARRCSRFQLASVHLSWSEHSELEAGGLRHPVLAPGWVPDQLDVDVTDAGNGLDRGACVFFEDVAHAAAGSRHGHLDLDAVGAVGERLCLAEVDQPQVHDIDGDFGVEDVLELRDHLIQFEGCPVCGDCFGGGAGQSERGGVLGTDPYQVSPLGLDGGAAAQGLRHDDLLTALEQHRLTARDHRCLAVLLEFDYLVLA